MAEVRPARPEDQPILVEFNARLAEETEDKILDRDCLSRGVRDVLQDPSKGRYFVVEDEGQVVAGLMIVTEYSDWRNGYFWWIHSVYTAPEARGRGHYSRLHGHVRRAALAEGNVRGLRLYVEHNNDRAQEVYSRRGMSRTGYLVFEEEFQA